MPTWQDGESAHALVAARLGVDDRLPACTPWDWRGARGAAVTTGGPTIRALRMVKTPEELSALHGAGEAVDRVHARIGEWLRPGRTEDEIGSDIAAALAEEGHERADFVIVASGPHEASPPPRAVRPCRARRRARRRRHRRAGAQRPLQRFDAVQPQRAGLAPSRLSPVGVGPGETAAGQCGAPHAAFRRGWHRAGPL